MGISMQHMQGLFYLTFQLRVRVFVTVLKEYFFYVFELKETVFMFLECRPEDFVEASVSFFISVFKTEMTNKL